MVVAGGGQHWNIFCPTDWLTPPESPLSRPFSNPQAAQSSSLALLTNSSYSSTIFFPGPSTLISCLMLSVALISVGCVGSSLSLTRRFPQLPKGERLPYSPDLVVIPPNISYLVSLTETDLTVGQYNCNIITCKMSKCCQNISNMWRSLHSYIIIFLAVILQQTVS